MTLSARSAISTLGLLCLLANPALAQTTDATTKVPGELSAALARATRMFDTVGPVESRSFRAVQPQQGYAAEVSSQGSLKIGPPGDTFNVRSIALGRGTQSSVVGAPQPSLGKDAQGWPTLTLSRSNLTEWYVNGQEGLHHWIRLHTRPGNASNSARVWVRMSLAGDVKLSHVADGVVQIQTEGNVLSYGGLKSWDSKHRELPAHFDISGQNLSIMVDDRGATYPVTIDPIWTQQQAVAPPPSPAASQFGIAVAIEGNTAVIGDIGSPATGFKGAAYVFKRSPSLNAGVWTLFQKLTNTEDSADDWFGKSVAISRRMILVGAPHANGWSGKAFAYYHHVNGTAYGLSSTLSVGANPSYRFGSHVALFCPTDSSLDARALVSYAVEESTLQAPVPAKVETFYDDHSGLGLMPTGSLISPGNFPAGQFGRSVAITTEFPGSTQAVALVGEPGAYNGHGTVWIYRQTPGTAWYQFTGLLALSPSSNSGASAFGTSIATRGLLTIVGAPGPGSSGNAAGAAYVFSDFTVGGSSELLPPTPTPNMRFGAAVAIDGNRAIVGAPSELPASRFGKAYVYLRNSTPNTFTYDLQQQLTASDAHYGQQFGAAVAISGSKILVGTDQLASPNGAYFFWKNPDLGLNISGALLGGFHSVGRIMISIPAPEGGVILRLKSSSDTLLVPSSLTIPEGGTTVEFNAFAAPVGSDTRVEILVSATGFTSTSAGVTVLAPSMTKLRFNRSEVNFGGQATGFLRLNGPAPLGGLSYALTQAIPGQLMMPEAVIVLAGQMEGSFTVIGNRTAPSDAIQTVRAGTAMHSTAATIVVRSLVELESLTLSPNTIGLGQSTVGMVRLMSPAPSAGQRVMLASDHSSVTVPDSVAVPGGSTTAQFTINTTGATSLPVKISGRVGATTKNATLHFKPLAVKSLALGRRNISELSSTTLTVTLNYPVPASFPSQQFVIASSATGFLKSLSVSVKPGEATVVVPIKPAFAKLAELIAVELAWNRGEANERVTTLTLNPAIKSFELSPTTVKGGGVSVGTITLFEPIEGSFTASSGSSLVYFDATTNPIRTTVAGRVYQFLVRTRAPKSTTDATVSISGLGYVRRATLTIERP